MTQTEDWMQEAFPMHPIRDGRTMDDPDFPRIAITYSLEENSETSQQGQEEMTAIIQDYNTYYRTAWSLQDIERYNGDINNRLAKKKAEFKEFGRQVDLVIVVDRLLTGFDAPTIQTFSRTNRNLPREN